MFGYLPQMLPRDKNRFAIYKTFLGQLLAYVNCSDNNITITWLKLVNWDEPE
jgi:hypothetical protein